MSGFTPCDQPELAIPDLQALLQPLVGDAGARDARDVQQAPQLHRHLFTRTQSFLDALGRTVNHVFHQYSSCDATGGLFCTVEGSRVAKKGWLAARSMDGGCLPTAASSQTRRAILPGGNFRRAARESPRVSSIWMEGPTRTRRVGLPLGE